MNVYADKHLKGMMDLARLKTIKLFRKAPPAVPVTANTTPLSLASTTHTATVSSPSPINLQKRTQSQSKFSDHTSDSSVNLEDRITEVMSITDRDNNKPPKPTQAATGGGGSYNQSNHAMPPKPSFAPAPADNKAAPAGGGLFRKFVGGKTK